MDMTDLFKNQPKKHTHITTTRSHHLLGKVQDTAQLQTSFLPFHSLEYFTHTVYISRIKFSFSFYFRILITVEYKLSAVRIWWSFSITFDTQQVCGTPQWQPACVTSSLAPLGLGGRVGYVQSISQDLVWVSYLVKLVVFFFLSFLNWITYHQKFNHLLESELGKVTEHNLSTRLLSAGSSTHRFI